MRVLVLFPLVAGVFAVAGCGSDDSADGTPPPASAGQTIQISATDFEFDPPTIPLEQAGEYTFRLVNDGGTEHALEIEGQGVEEETETIGPGETAELTLSLEPGEYEMYCPVDGHREMGMEGSVSVGGAAAGGGTTTDGDGTTTDDDGTTTDEDSGGYNY
jgi:plastocyanin